MPFFVEPSVIRPGPEPMRVVTDEVLPVHWLMIAVRTMGDASYVAFGTRTAQESRLTGAGDFYTLDVPGGGVFDAGSLWCRCDAVVVAPELEIWAMGADR